MTINAAPSRPMSLVGNFLRYHRILEVNLFVWLSISLLSENGTNEFSNGITISLAMVFLIAHFENILKNDCQVKDRLLNSNKPDILPGGMKYEHINLAL